MTITGRRTPRSGAAILWALVVLAVLSVMTATAAWQFGAARRGLEQRQNRLQAVWLARAGCELAAAGLLTDPDGYTGKTAEPIPDGRVTITVEKASADPDTYHVRCEANYPVGDRAEVSKSATRTVIRRTDGGKPRVEVTAADGP
jgi:type II secretory pathway pseudopilin PulG